MNATAAAAARQLHVYTNAPFCRLLVNGKPTAGGGTVAVAPFSAATFNGITFTPGTVTAECLAGADASAGASAGAGAGTSAGAAGVGGRVLLTHTKCSCGEPAAIKLTLDAPSTTTGTGSTVYLDGADVALIRATVVDAAGVVVHSSVANVTFAVAVGPARVVGCGNGDPADRHPNHAPWKPAYHGLVRAIVQTTVKAAGSAAERSLEALVNPEAGLGPKSSSLFLQEEAAVATQFKVTAHSPGLAPATLTVRLSADDADSPLNVAAASIELADIGIA